MVDRSIPLILRRSFLRTAKMIIDVYDRKLILRIVEDTVEFNLRSTMNYPQEVKDYWSIVTNKDLVEELIRKNFSTPTLEEFIKNIRS